MIRTFFSNGCNAALVLLLAAWLAGAGLGAWQIHPAMALLGATIFLAGEYGFHRYVLHARLAPAGSRIRRVQQRLHYDHHAQPQRLDRLFLPAWFLIAGLGLTVGLASLAWPDAGSVMSFVGGVATATVHYEWTHYVAHISYRPRTAWGRRLKRNHLWHHFRDEHSRFGVTHPVMDVLLRTDRT